MLCIAAYNELIAKVRRTIWDDMAILIWCFPFTNNPYRELDWRTKYDIICGDLK